MWHCKREILVFFNLRLVLITAATVIIGHCRFSMNARQAKVNDRGFVYIVVFSGNSRKLGAMAGYPVDYYKYDSLNLDGQQYLYTDEEFH